MDLSVSLFHDRNFFVVDRRGLQGRLEAVVYRGVANTSDNELSKRNKELHMQFLSCNSSSLVCSVSGLMNHYHGGGRKFDSCQVNSKMELIMFLSKCRSPQYTSNGSQQATIVTPNTFTTKDVQVSVFKYQVLRRPFFSIGHSQIARLTRHTNGEYLGTNSQKKQN